MASPTSLRSLHGRLSLSLGTYHPLTTSSVFIHTNQTRRTSTQWAWLSAAQSTVPTQHSLCIRKNHQLRAWSQRVCTATSSLDLGQLQEFKTIATQHTELTEVKKSKFIASAKNVESPAEAMAFIDSLKDVSASHNCFAYKIGSEYRFSDDGEPGGTAGRPILSAIEGSGVDRVVVLVTRFFGGTKLGAGGLVRAYGGAASACLKAASTVHVYPKVAVVLSCGFSQVGVLYAKFEEFGASDIQEEYSEKGEGGVHIRLQVQAGNAERLQAAIKDATHGNVLAEIQSHQAE